MSLEPLNQNAGSKMQRQWLSLFLPETPGSEMSIHEMSVERISEFSAIMFVETVGEPCKMGARAGEVAQFVKCLLCNQEGLSSNP